MCYYSTQGTVKAIFKLLTKWVATETDKGSALDASWEEYEPDRHKTRPNISHTGARQRRVGGDACHFSQLSAGSGRFSSFLPLLLFNLCNGEATGNVAVVAKLSIATARQLGWLGRGSRGPISQDWPMRSVHPWGLATADLNPTSQAANLGQISGERPAQPQLQQ